MHLKLIIRIDLKFYNFIFQINYELCQLMHFIRLQKHENTFFLKNTQKVGFLRKKKRLS